MRILQINSAFYSRGGADKVFLSTVSLLEKNGHEVLIFTTQDSRNEISAYDKYFVGQNNVRQLTLLGKIIHLPKFIYNRNAYSKLKQLIDEERPEIAHIHLFLGAFTTSILRLLNSRNIPIVLTVHDYRLICPAYLFLNGKGEICEACRTGHYINCLLKRCSENMISQSLVLALDAYFRKYFIKPVTIIDKFLFVCRFSMLKHIEYNSKYQIKSTVLYNFIPNLRIIEPVKKKGNYFLYFGRLSPEKGIEALIRAAKISNVNLKIAGTGIFEEQYRRFSTSKIELLGYQSGKELATLIANSLFVVVPSINYENNPMSIIESYALGKPVIGSQIGSIPEIIENNRTGFLFKSGDYVDLSNVLNKATNITDEDYLEMSKNARNFVEKYFDPEKHYSDLIKIYNELLS